MLVLLHKFVKNYDLNFVYFESVYTILIIKTILMNKYQCDLNLNQRYYVTKNRVESSETKIGHI